jgi:hypothetical protein
MIKPTVPRVALLLTAVAAVAAGCSGQTTKTPTPSGTPSAAVAVGARPAVATTAPTPPAVATTTPAEWSTAPVTVVHNPPVPPVPVVTAIRYAAHPEQDYDRIVFDIPGALPGYTAKYVTRVVQDGTGDPVSLPGSRFLLIVFTPAQAHTEAGRPTISGTHHINLPMIESYAVVGDYEGYVSVALGLNGKAGFHIAELSGRIYVDVAA